MSSNSVAYRMMVLLEEDMEPIEDDINLKSESSSNDNTEKVTTTKNTEPKKSHEFIDELILPFHVDELDILNEWFDKFDEQICIPNEGHIKYEITSDGLIILILDNDIKHVVEQVKDFVQNNQ
ncbi:hypothetical protein TBLA_0B03190 [Henningerozyma blattae CBS 6284]|uniref:Uncharacterized protein n=1 Tax=Henningerozyma blattae (strain ATCC 34711 / CBS 6284 / DSM 70876 / NBRC 10599 / NRRL Y-10934 / UCD 77-7) TaxID=1071380 RepID=I2GYF8_HENB6|nr:hypothetical protein TBLA_0B03190 [Tetrapisispora blattae CBS 6284]CCH59160.1 hypothetical protein TBLA_0B03190 [Tetrapisispora blattae CBS 6284]